MSWQQKRNHIYRPYCPFKKFCVFLKGEEPERVLGQRDYLSKRVDELEFAMDIGNHQALKLQERIKELEETNSLLKTELVEALQDPFTKYARKIPSENPKKRGAPLGHPGWFRSKPKLVDKTVDVYLDCCPHCGNKDISPCNHTTEHIQQDLEDGKLATTCFVHLYYWCSHCRKIVHGWGENEIPNAFIGPDVRAKASFMRYEVKASYNGTRLALQCFGNLALSAAALVGFDNHISKQGKSLYDTLKRSLPKSPFIHVDETGWKRDWLWIFTNPKIAFFHIDESRGSKVVIDHLGEFYNGVLITDFWSAYRSNVGAFAKQKCLVHLLRDIKKLLDNELPKQKHPDAEPFLTAVKQLIQDAIFLHNHHDALTSDEYRSGRKDILKRFRTLYRHTPLSHHESDNIRKRLITFKNELFVFLKYPAVSPTNNFAEQGIRNSVIFRKITFGNMSARGKINVALAMTIIRTALRRALDPIEILRFIAARGATPELLKRFNLAGSVPGAP